MAQDWQVVAALAAAGGALLVGTVQVCAIAYWGGGVSQRIKALEEKVQPIGELASEMATLGERIRNLMTRLDAHDALAGGPPPLQRSRARRSPPGLEDAG